MINVHRKIVCKFQIAYSEIFRRFIWQLPKVQFFGYCASYNYFAAAHLPIICPLQIDQLFQQWKSSKYLFTVHRKVIWQLQIAYLETFQWFMSTALRKIFWLLRNYHFATAHLPLICLLQIDQLFHQWKSSKYLLTVHRKIVWHFQIAYSKIFRRFNYYCATPNFLSTAHHTIIFLLRISQLSVYC